VKKGDFVLYQARSGPITAIVRRVYRDGSALIEARFVHGKPLCYLGYRFRLPPERLTPTDAIGP